MRSSFTTWRNTGIVLILLFFLWVLVSLTLSRYYFHGANRKTILHKDYAAGYRGYNRALNVLPTGIGPFFCRVDQLRIHHAIGQFFLVQAKNTVNILDRYGSLITAGMHFKSATDINSHDVDPAKGLAETTALLERYYSVLFPRKPNPHDALPLYETLVQLRPEGLTVHYMTARYLYGKNMTQALSKAVEQIAFIFPADVINGDLKAEIFYSDRLHQATARGLDRAVAEGRQRRNAFLALSRMAEDDNDFSLAIGYYQKAMAYKKYKNNAGHYLHLGTLFLKTGQADNAFASFQNVLAISPSFDSHFNRIYQIFTGRESAYQFLEFTGTLDEKIIARHPVVVGICVARARMSLGLNELARAGLLQMVSEKSDARAYYLLSRIAEMEKDWDEMEINIQKATVLDPDNCGYYYEFARALSRQGKHTRAAMEKARAKTCSNTLTLP